MKRIITIFSFTVFLLLSTVDSRILQTNKFNNPEIVFDDVKIEPVFQEANKLQTINLRIKRQTTQASVRGETVLNAQNSYGLNANAGSALGIPSTAYRITNTRTTTARPVSSSTTTTRPTASVTTSRPTSSTSYPNNDDLDNVFGNTNDSTDRPSGNTKPIGNRPDKGAGGRHEGKGKGHGHHGRGQIGADFKFPADLPFVFEGLKHI